MKTKKNNLQKYIIPKLTLKKQNSLVYLKHKMNRSSINCNL